MLPYVFQEMFLKNISVHNYPTFGGIHLPLLRDPLSSKIHLYNEGPKLWNSLSNEVKNALSINVIKKKKTKGWGRGRRGILGFIGQHGLSIAGR